MRPQIKLPDWSLRRQLEFRSFDEALAEVERLLAGGYERRGNWDLAQSCDHLADAFQGSVRGFTFAAPWVVRAVFGRLGLWYVLRNRTAPFRPMMPKELEPPRGKDVCVCVGRLREAVGMFQNFNGPLASHPFFGRISADEWRRIHLFHMAHHLAFLAPLAPTAGSAPGSPPTDKTDPTTVGGAIPSP